MEHIRAQFSACFHGQSFTACLSNPGALEDRIFHYHVYITIINKSELIWQYIDDDDDDDDLSDMLHLPHGNT